MVMRKCLRKGPSPHLTWQELACKDGTPYPEEFIEDGRVFKLAQTFEQIRLLAGEYPITILSAYRTPEHNRKVGGARNSQHVEGRALDLKPPKTWSVKSFYELIRRYAPELGIHGLGRYKTFVHVDIRPTKTIAYWSGDGIKDSRTRT